MKIIITGVLAALVLSGCTDATRSTIATRGAQAADQTLESAEWVMCHAASIGSVKRRYGKTEETARAYRELCEGTGDPDVVGAPE